VSIAREDREVVLAVSDTGVGIRAEFLPYLFERFRQADASLTRRHGGLGLGLAIVRSVVELHGGTVTAASDGEGKGATFHISLPLSYVNDDDAADIVIGSGEAGAGALAGLDVLVVEDEPDTRAFLATLLDNVGVRVHTAGSVAEAMASFEAAAPCLVVADIGMPGEDGFALLRRIRARGSTRGGDVPVLALTAYAGRADRERALAAGFTAHLSKPVEPDDLIATLTGLVPRQPG
jgi:CheY-like chemotaxis protein